ALLDSAARDLCALLPVALALLSGSVSQHLLHESRQPHLFRAGSGVARDFRALGGSLGGSAAGRSGPLAPPANPVRALSGAGDAALCLLCRKNRGRLHAGAPLVP